MNSDDDYVGDLYDMDVCMQLMDAVNHRRIDDVSSLIGIGMPSCGSHAVTRAIEIGAYDIAILLIEHGAIIEEFNHQLLSEAVHSGRTNAAREILKAARSYKQPRAGALHSDDADVLAFIMDHYGPVVSVSLANAITFSAVNIVKFLVSRGEVPKTNDWNICSWLVGDRETEIFRCFLSNGFIGSRINPYDHVAFLNEKHLYYPHLPYGLKKIVEWRCGMGRRMMRSPADVIIVIP